MNTVYVPHYPMRMDPLSRKEAPVYNIDKAKQFGEPVVIVRGAPRQSADNILELMRRTFDNSKAGDYLLCLGDPVLLVLASQAMAERHGVVNILRFDKYAGEYTPISIVTGKEGNI